jgi:hypothetical protein
MQVARFALVVALMGVVAVISATSQQPSSQMSRAGALRTKVVLLGTGTTGWPRAVARSPAPTERSVQISRTTLVRRWFTARR